MGSEPYEVNHVFGKRNSALTIRYPINDHRAVFNVKQLDWTPETLENVNGDPLLEAIARFHGLDNNVVQMLTDCIEFLPKMKLVRDQLVAVYGANWPQKLEAAGRPETHQVRSESVNRRLAERRLSIRVWSVYLIRRTLFLAACSRNTNTAITGPGDDEANQPKHYTPGLPKGAWPPP